MAFALKGAGSATTAFSAAANQASLVVTTATTAGASGDLAVLLYAVDNNATVDGDEGAVTGVTDSAGNYWQKAVEFTNGQGTAQTGATCGIWFCNLQNPLAISSTVTLTFNNTASRDASAASLTYYTMAAGFKASVEGTPGTLANDAAAAGSLDSTTANIACLRIRAIASESSTATALTKTAAFTAVLTQAVTATGATATNQGIRGEYLISTATGAASAPTGGAGAVDNASVYVAFKEVAVTVGDPPHNLDYGGALVAINTHKAIAATLVAASAGLFLLQHEIPPSPPAPNLQIGVPLQMGSAPPRVRSVYYQARVETPYAAPAAPGVPGRPGWEIAFPSAPPVAKAQAGFSSVPYNTAQVVAAAPATQTGVPLDFGGVLPQLRDVYYQARVEIPYVAPAAAVQAPSGWQQQLAGAPRSSAAQPGFFDAQLGPPSTLTGGWQQSLSGAPPLATARPGWSFVPFDTAQRSVNFTAFGWHQALVGAPAVIKPQAGFAFVPYDTAQLSVNFSPLGWQSPLDPAPRGAVKPRADFASLPYAPPPAVNIAWHAPLSFAPPLQRALDTPYQLPVYTAVVVVTTATLDWQQPLSVAPAVAKAQAGSSFVPFDTTQISVLTSYGWLAQLSTAPPLARAQLGFLSSPYGVTVSPPSGWLQALSTAPTTAKTQVGWAYVPYNTAQRSVNFTPLDWQVPLSIAPVPVKAQLGLSSVPYNTAQLSVNFTAFGWQGPIATAPASAKSSAGFVSSPYRQAATATLDWQSALSIAPPVRRATDTPYQLPPYITIVVSSTVTIGWQAPLSVALPTIKPQAGFSYVPYDTAQIVASAGVPVDMGGALRQRRDVYYQSSVSPIYVPPIVNTVTIDKWQLPLSVAPPVNKAQAGFSYVPYNTAQLVVGTYTDWFLPALSSAPPVARPQAGFSSVPYNTPQLSVNFTPLDWQSPLSTAAPVAKAAPTQPAFVSAPLAVPQGWYQALSTPPLVAKVSYNNQPQPGPPSATSNINWQQPLSFAPSRTAAQLGSVVQPAYVAPVTVAGIAGMAWFTPLSIPVKMRTIPRQSDILSITRYDTVAPVGTLPHSKPFFVTPGKLMNI